MKNSIIALFFFLLCQALSAQEIWLETGIKGGYGMSFLYDKNLVDDEDVNYKLTSMYGFGAKFAVNFGPAHGISLEAMYNKLAQDFDYSLPGGTKDQTTSVEWKNIDAALLYRYAQNKMFVEIGPQYSFVRSVEQQDELTSVTPFYEKNYLSGVFGFGGYAAGSGTFSVELGIRLHYGLTDFVTSEGKLAGYPIPGKGAVYPDDKPTHPAYAEFMVAFNFGIGYFAKTSCSERMHFFSGN